MTAHDCSKCCILHQLQGLDAGLERKPECQDAIIFSETPVGFDDSLDEILLGFGLLV
jgi:hypothetical protein